MGNSVFITGGTGYMGSRLIPLLVKRGHQVKALVRSGSETKLAAGALGVVRDALKRIHTPKTCAGRTRLCI
jgi:uncharacterized protein YbjT (DUF2867 family)